MWETDPSSPRLSPLVLSSLLLTALDDTMKNYLKEQSYRLLWLSAVGTRTSLSFPTVSEDVVPNRW